MHLVSTPESCVFIDLRAAGLLQAVAHSPTLAARPDRIEFDVPPGEAVDVAVVARFSARSIEPPAQLSSGDRDKMRENLRGRDVLDVARFPDVEWRGRYTGTLDGGRLVGDLVVRGAPHPVALDVSVAGAPRSQAGSPVSGAGEAAARGAALAATGRWEGRLTDLGIKPFRALLGALRLEDWIRIRLEASFSCAD